MPSKCLVIQKKCVHGSFRCAQPVLRNHTPAFDLPHRGRRKWLAPRIPLLATIFANSRQLCQIGENLNTVKSEIFCIPIFFQIFCDILLHVDTLHESNWLLNFVYFLYQRYHCPWRPAIFPVWLQVSVHLFDNPPPRWWESNPANLSIQNKYPPWN